ncbi:MAG: TonB-dependent receptor [Saprospiraceae bacterium]|nr:TonB-dependent receptor [Saprospiraceae bacterium]
MPLKLPWFILFLICFGTVYSQKIIEGQVFDENNQTLPGAVIRILNTTKGTIANENGVFSIEAGIGATLEISYTGFEIQLLTVPDERFIKIQLIALNQKLDEVVVVGYGTARKKDLTGSSTNIKGSDLANIPALTATQAIQGKAAGVQVINNGAPGSAPTVRIRGTGSILGGVEPLYVVDGVLTGDIRNINNSDILSIDILKDASSTAIYGVRAANGVVVITTKSGKKNSLEINYQVQGGVRLVSNKVEMAKSNLYAIYSNEAAGAFEIIESDISAKTDWLNEITRPAMSHQHHLSVHGGGDKNKFFIGAGYLKEEGLLMGSDYERINLRINNQVELSNKIKIGNTLTLSRFLTNNKPISVFTQAYLASPIYPAKLNDQSFGFTDKSNVGNPLATLAYTHDKSWGARILGSLFGEYSILESLKFNTSFGLDAAHNTGQIYTPVYRVNGVQKNERSSLSILKTDLYNWVWDNYVSYIPTLNNIHFLKFTVGHSAERFDGKFVSGLKKDIPPQEQYWSFDYGDPNSIESKFGNDGQYGSRESYFGRINYTFDEKYLLNASLRRDGASKFAARNRWGWFPAIGLGWQLSREDFFKNTLAVVNELKLRISYGLNGNDNINPSQFATQFQGGLLAPFGDQLQPGTIPVDIIDPDLKWEVAKEFDFGIEGLAFDRRLNFEIDLYNKLVNDALYIVKLPATTGDDEYLTNAATIRNKGIEISIGWTPKNKHRFTNIIQANITFNSNKVENIGLGQALSDGSLNNGWLATQTLAGYEIGSFYVFKTDGLFQTQTEVDSYPHLIGTQPGDFKILDVNGDGVIDAKDRIHEDSYQPKVYFGISNNLSWKNWNLNIDIYGNLGNKVFNGKKTQRSLGSNFNMEYDEANKRWQASNPTNEYPRASNRRSEPLDYYLESGSFIRLNNVSLSYTFKKQDFLKIKTKNLRVFLTAQNAFTWKKYTGFTAELPGKPLNSGIELNAYPTNAVYMMGIQVGF